MEDELVDERSLEEQFSALLLQSRQANWQTLNVFFGSYRVVVLERDVLRFAQNTSHGLIYVFNKLNLLVAKFLEAIQDV